MHGGGDRGTDGDAEVEPADAPAGCLQDTVTGTVIKQHWARVGLIAGTYNDGDPDPGSAIYDNFVLCPSVAVP